MKIMIITIIIVVVFLLLYILFLDNDEKQQDLMQEPYINGIIYSIDDNRILVVENIKEDTYKNDIDNFVGNAVWFTINNDSLINSGLKINDLQLGDRIEVWHSGLVLESYPAQTTAAKIRIIEKHKEKEIENKEPQQFCFIGGCSGELCTDNPEAISTCELLPGMECLTKEMTCQLINNQCTWVLSQSAAQCFVDVQKKQGDTVLETRIGYLFVKAKELIQ